ncbi:hypothetical protein PLESTF_000479400 [Pleodorina starrii]|nr:hypothetical protein PLESTF_000479400 [Pleodorina starrii]
MVARFGGLQGRFEGRGARGAVEGRGTPDAGAGAGAAAGALPVCWGVRSKTAAEKETALANGPRTQRLGRSSAGWQHNEGIPYGAGGDTVQGEGPHTEKAPSEWAPPGSGLRPSEYVG